MSVVPALFDEPFFTLWIVPGELQEIRQSTNVARTNRLELE
jgi:hypothetical protein